jgi:hypothetical protein
LSQGECDLPSVWKRADATQYHIRQVQESSRSLSGLELRAPDEDSIEDGSEAGLTPEMDAMPLGHRRGVARYDSVHRFRRGGDVGDLGGFAGSKAVAVGSSHGKAKSGKENSRL